MKEIIKVRQYSGKRSKKFWARIGAIPYSEAGQQFYIMGCILQDTESRVLAELEQWELKNCRRRESPEVHEGLKEEGK